MSLPLRMAWVLVMVVAMSALVSLSGVPACAEDWFKQGEWDRPEDAPCVVVAGPGVVIHATLASREDYDWIRLQPGSVMVPVGLSFRGEIPPTVWIVAPGLDPGPSTLDIPDGMGAEPLPAADSESFVYWTFLRIYRRVAMGTTPATGEALLLITGGEGNYLLTLGSRPGFSLRGLIAWPASFLRVWIGAHD